MRKLLGGSERTSLKVTLFRRFSSESHGHIRSVEMERWAVSATHGISSDEVSISHLFLMGECPSLEAKRDSSHEAEKFLRTNPIPGLRKYKVLQLDLSCSTVNEKLDSIDEAG